MHAIMAFSARSGRRFRFAEPAIPPINTIRNHKERIKWRERNTMMTTGVL